MDPRRAPRTVIGPKVRQVGFFAPGAPPDRSLSGPADPMSSSSSPPLVSDLSPSANSLSPVMIPPPRHLSDSVLLSARTVPFPPVPTSPLRRDSVTAASYNPSEVFPGTSPTISNATKVVGNGEYSDDVFFSPGRKARSNSIKSAAAVAAVSSSFPSGGFDAAGVKASSVPGTALVTASLVKMPSGISVQVAEKSGGASNVASNDCPANSKPLKEKTTKAERRALQEAQRAAKAAAKAEGSKTPAAASAAANSGNTKVTKSGKATVQKTDGASVTVLEKGGERLLEKDRKKDAPHPRMQYDDESRVEKAKKRSVVKQTEARNRVELFRHLPQYEHGTQLPDLESKFFQLDPVHPAVYKVGLQYLSGDISGSNARCIAMLQAFQETIRVYTTPPEKTLTRDLTSKINSYVSFLNECRPISISMGNAIKFLKSRIAKLPLNLSETEAKVSLLSDVDQFIAEKIIVAEKVIANHAVTKIQDGDVLLTYGSSSVVELILVQAHELGKQFRVIIVDSRPKLEGQLLLRRLVAKGLCCSYTHINAVSYIMKEVTRVFLGAASVLSNGTVYSRVGTACVAMVAHAFHVPVLVCCEAYKFHERVQLDSICANELGDPGAVAEIPDREEVNKSGSSANSENLQFLNLIYDLMPSDYVSMIITDYGMVPTTSVPVIVREYRREHLCL